MDKPFEQFVMVWIPNNDEEKSAGILSYSQDEGIYLNLYNDETIFTKQDIEQREFLIGQTQKGELFTLYDCLIVESKSAIFRGFTKTRFRVKFLFIGVHFTNYDEIKFSSMYGGFTDLSTWLIKTGFSNEHNIDNPEDFQSICSYKRPQEITFKVNKEIRRGVAFSLNESHKIRKFIIEERPVIFVRSESEDLHFEALNRYLQIFSALLQISCQRKVYPLNLYGVIKPDSDNKNSNPIHIDIYYQPVEAIRDVKSLNPSDFLFKFEDLTNTMVQNWFNFYNEYKTEIGLHQTLFYNERSFIETRFLNIATALESLHSHLFDNFYLDKKTYSSRVEQIIKSVSSEYIEWLKNIFSNANYKSFKEKMLELLGTKLLLVSQLIEDEEEFVLSVRDTRNELVHHSKHKRTLKVPNLLYAIYILKFIFEAFLFEMIGFSDEMINTINSKRVKRFLSWGKKL